MVSGQPSDDCRAKSSIPQRRNRAILGQVKILHRHIAKALYAVA